MNSEAGDRGKVRAYLLQSAETKRQVSEKCLDSIVAAADLIGETFRGGWRGEQSFLVSKLECRRPPSPRRRSSKGCPSHDLEAPQELHAILDFLIMGALSQ